MIDELEAKVLRATKALVRINGKDAAELEMLATDEFRFQYLASYCEPANKAIPLSLALPLRREAYISETLLPFFDNLLFEGEQLRLVEKKFGLNRRSTVDRFRLLLLTGQDNLSLASIVPLVAGQPIDFHKTVEKIAATEFDLYPLQSAYDNTCPVCLTLAPAIHPACRKALWGTAKKIRMEAFAQDPQNIFKTMVPGQSLSGAQRKALFSLNKNAVLTRTGNPTHIIKPEGEFAEMPANEHLTMAVAKQLKFRVPAVGLFRIEGMVGFLYVTRRFDRDPQGQGLGFEDAAQLAGELAEDKDKASMATIANILTDFASSPAIEYAEFFKRLLFCFLTGNGDMHLKNWGLLYNLDSNLTKLAPVYDFINVRCCFPQERVEMLLPLNGKSSGLTRADFSEFGRQTLQLNTRYIEETFALMDSWAECLQEFSTRSALTAERRQRYMDVVYERLKRLSGTS